MQITSRPTLNEKDLGTVKLPIGKAAGTGSVIILPKLSIAKASNIRGNGLVRDKTILIDQSVLRGKANLLEASARSRNGPQYRSQNNLFNNNGSRLEGAVNRAMSNPYGQEMPLLKTMKDPEDHSNFYIQQVR